MTELFPFQGLQTHTDIFDDEITEGAEKVISDLKLLEIQIDMFKHSGKRKLMLDGERYYDGYHDILKAQRTMIGEGGRLQVVQFLPNSRTVDNRYAKLVDQKVNYQVGKPITLDSDNEGYVDALKLVFDKRFHRTLKNVMTDAMNGGIAYLFPTYKADGTFTFKRLPTSQFIPFWLDGERNELEYGVHFYDVVQYEGVAGTEKTVEKVDVYGTNGIEHYVRVIGTGLVPDIERNGGSTPYLTIANTNEDGSITQNAFNWSNIPVIPFKFNSREVPLIQRVKTLQDAINQMLSDFENRIQENAYNSIFVVKNYGGQSLVEFRKNISEVGAVKVETYDGVDGDVSTLTVEFNSENYDLILSMLQKAIVENGRGYDTSNDKSSAGLNELNIKSMYSNIELDATGIDTEFQASFEDLVWFVNRHIENVTGVNYDNESVEIIFNRDTLVSESEVIKNILDSPYLSLDTKLAQHPYVTDPIAEKALIKQEQLDGYDLADNYETTFPINEIV